jgi:hypothetical protein
MCACNRCRQHSCSLTLTPVVSASAICSRLSMSSCSASSGADASPPMCCCCPGRRPSQSTTCNMTRQAEVLSSAAASDKHTCSVATDPPKLIVSNVWVHGQQVLHGCQACQQRFMCRGPEESLVQCLFPIKPFRLDHLTLQRLASGHRCLRIVPLRSWPRLGIYYLRHPRAHRSGDAHHVPGAGASIGIWYGTLKSGQTSPASPDAYLQNALDLAFHPLSHADAVVAAQQQRKADVVTAPPHQHPAPCCTIVGYPCSTLLARMTGALRPSADSQEERVNHNSCTRWLR